MVMRFQSPPVYFTLDWLQSETLSTFDETRVHLSTEEPASSRMLEQFGEVGGDVPEYFSSRTHFAKN